MNENPRAEDRGSRYPFQWTFPAWGLGVGLVAGLAMQSALAGVALFTVSLCAGLLWRRDEPPILAFAIAYQWIYVVAGYFYGQLGGHFTDDRQVGNLERAIGLSLAGFVVLALGIRVALAVLEGLLQRHWYPRLKQAPDYDIKRLAWWTMGLYAVSWVVEILPMAIFYRGAQIIYACLTVREVLLGALWVTILQHRRGYRHGVLALVIAWLPLLISTQSRFKELLFFFVIVLLAYWRPWTHDRGARRLNKGILTTASLIAAGLVYLGSIWEGAIKPNWRWANVQGSPIEKLRVFSELIRDPVRQMKLSEGLGALMHRVDSVWQFSLVLNRVPDQVPFQNGALTRRAIIHIVTPRILFPNKTDLGLDSAITTRYAGIEIGEGASVGIGYMAEFYVDYGPWFMFAPLFGFGFFLGLIYAGLFFVSEQSNLVQAAVIIPFLNNFLGYESDFAKMLGGFIMIVIILTFFLKYFGPAFHARMLTTRMSRHGRASIWRGSQPRRPARTLPR